MILPVPVPSGVATLTAAWHFRSSYKDLRSRGSVGPGFRPSEDAEKVEFGPVSGRQHHAGTKDRPFIIIGLRHG